MTNVSLNQLIANLYGQYFNLHTFHWNIQGANFKELHDFSGDLYSDVFGSIDDFAEQSRQLGFLAPLSLKGLLNKSQIEELDSVDVATLSILESDNSKVLVSLYQTYKEADEAKELGLANLLQDRIQVHKKYDWVLKSFQSNV